MTAEMSAEDEKDVSKVRFFYENNQRFFFTFSP